MPHVFAKHVYSIKCSNPLKVSCRPKTFYDGLSIVWSVHFLHLVSHTLWDNTNKANSLQFIHKGGGISSKAHTLYYNGALLCIGKLVCSYNVLNLMVFRYKYKENIQDINSFLGFTWGVYLLVERIVCVQLIAHV